jgi:hypothetical protein
MAASLTTLISVRPEPARKCLLAAVRLDPRSSTYCLRLLSIYPVCPLARGVPDPRHHTICTGTEFWNLELALKLQANLSRPASSWGVFANA